MPNWKKVIVSGSDATLTSVTATAGFTGSLQGTASFAVSSSFASTASYVLNAVSSSFASTASFVNPLTQTVTINGKLIQTGSHAQGLSTIASGDYSHAEGSNTIANGNYSHAEGYGTGAGAGYAHAEGFNTTANANYSHAEGGNTITNGEASHAEGSGTLTQGNYSHAEGQYTTSSGGYSHAEGVNTIAIGNYTHAEGNGTTPGYRGYGSGTTGVTAGVFSLDPSYGDLTSIFTSSSFVLFDDTTGAISGTPNVIKAQVSSSIYITGGIDEYTEVTLFDTTIDSLSTGLVVGIFGTPQPAGANGSIGNYSHAEGESTTTIGLASHAEGYGTLTQGYYSHAEGFNTVAQGNYQHVQGQYNITSSAQSAFIVGNGTADGARSNLIFASGSQVQITGSLIVSGSGTFTNIGPAVFSGSVTSTAGFTGSLQGTASFALAVAGGGGGTILKLTAQTLTSASWSLVSGYYSYTFSNANITVNTRVDFTPDRTSYLEVTTCGMQTQVTVAAGSCIFYSLFPPQTNITGEITIFPTV